MENHDGFAELGGLGELYLLGIGHEDAVGTADARPGLEVLVCDLSLCLSRLCPLLLNHMVSSWSQSRLPLLWSPQHLPPWPMKTDICRGWVYPHTCWLSEGKKINEHWTPAKSWSRLWHEIYVPRGVAEQIFYCAQSGLWTVTHLKTQAFEPENVRLRINWKALGKILRCPHGLVSVLCRTLGWKLRACFACGLGRVASFLCPSPSSPKMGISVIPSWPV